MVKRVLKSFYCDNDGCCKVLHSEIDIIDHVHYEHGIRLVIHKGTITYIHKRLPQLLHYIWVLRKRI